MGNAMQGQQAYQAFYEFPNTPCAGGNTNAYADCFGVHCTPCITPITTNSTFVGNGMTESAIYGDIDVCRASNNPDDSYFHFSGWNLAPSDSEWVQTEVVAFGIQVQLDSVTIIYRANGPTNGRIQVAFGSDPMNTVGVHTLVNGTTWTSASFDLSSTPCSDANLFTMIKIRFGAYGNSDPNGYVDVDAIRIYAHECFNISTYVDPNQNSQMNSVSILQMVDGVQISAQSTSEVSVCDMSGRVVYFNSGWIGTQFIPMNKGVYVVRAGNTVKKVALQ